MHIRYFYVTEQMRNKVIHITHCPTEEMVADFFTKPLQVSLFTKMRNYVMGNEEPVYQVLPRSVLSNDRTAGIRNKKSIGTRKHNSKATKSTGHVKDLDGPSGEHPMSSTQGTSSNACGIGDEQSNQSGRGAEQHDDVVQKVEPRSYRDALLNG